MMFNAAQSVGNLLLAMQQSQMQSQLAAYQQQSLLSGLQQASPSDLLGQLTAQQLCQPARPKSPPSDPRPYLMSRAESYAEQGYRLCERMAFWSAFGIVAQPIVSRLTERLEGVTSEVERFIEMAAIATEARRAETVQHGSVHEGAGRKASPTLPSHPQTTD